MQTAQKTYEAVLEDGQLDWLGEQPGTGRHRVLVIVLEQPRPSPEEVRRVLDAAYGAWGIGKSLDEIDAEIEEMRAEWDRPWDDPDWKPEL